MGKKPKPRLKDAFVGVWKNNRAPRKKKPYRDYERDRAIREFKQYIGIDDRDETENTEYELSNVTILQELCKIGGLPTPHYEYQVQGNPNKPFHNYSVNFRIPEILRSTYNIRPTHVMGNARYEQKKPAREQAAENVIMKLERMMKMEQFTMSKWLQTFKEQRQLEIETLQATPVEQQVPGVAWQNVPIDVTFQETEPAGRSGRISFHPEIVQHPRAFRAAKIATARSKEMLPAIVFKENPTLKGPLQQWANVITDGSLTGVKDYWLKESIGIGRVGAEIIALNKVFTSNLLSKDVDFPGNSFQSSFGMAKLFILWPRHQFPALKKLLDQVQVNSPEKEDSVRSGHSGVDKRRKELVKKADDTTIWNARVAIFRKHQQMLALPIDHVESKIPHEALVTIVRGGTASGKTTRYPLLLSLFSPTGASTRVLVAEPRRLACQTAARRVAFEQDSVLGSEDCPVGYAIRFASMPSKAHGRTIDFQTPGVILRKAMADPLLSDITHLCIDEVHERNADMDLLISLAKETSKKRVNHETLPPLRIILMSATLDSSRWESYFRDAFDDSTKYVQVLDVPEIRRFPVDVVHLGDELFPNDDERVVNMITQMEQVAKRADDSIVGRYDQALCHAMAQLATYLFEKQNLDGGSILCFLPGMDEIRLVDKMIQENFKDRQSEMPRITYLHSSLDSTDQLKVFESGSKIILSTNLSETSITIPDVKYVIDSGRERQHSLLDSMSSKTTVVGSQLTTENISKASAQQRQGRAGRVSEGTCYRLYTKDRYMKLRSFSLPEMQRMDVSQLILHALSFSASDSVDSLHFLRKAPDPPTNVRLLQALAALADQGHIVYDPNNPENVKLTSLGKLASSFPVPPRITRMLVTALLLRCIDPALQIAALLSVPQVFSATPQSFWNFGDSGHTSDTAKMLELYQEFLTAKGRERAIHPFRVHFQQVSRVHQQLEYTMRRSLEKIGPKISESEWSRWNSNSHRMAACIGIICCASTHIAHLMHDDCFATRDRLGDAKMHPSSVNRDVRRRAHWYLYQELRTTKEPYLHITTAASPLDLALFSEPSSFGDHESSPDEWNFVVDQWVPVKIRSPEQCESLLKLRRLLTNDLLQRIAQDRKGVLEDKIIEELVLHVLSGIELQRVRK